MLIVGIDPDAESHGVAVYESGKLVELSKLQLVPIIEKFSGVEVLFSIENVLANKFVYRRNQHNNAVVQSNIAMKVGRVQQAQAELMRLLDHLKKPYVLYEPQKGNWAKDRAGFELATGWAKNSNEDTRAAAYFGYLALRDSGQCLVKNSGDGNG